MIPLTKQEKQNAEEIEQLRNNKADKANITTGVEFETGRIIDGKKEYGKRINCGNLPNATDKSIATGLTNFNLTDLTISITDGYTQIMIPFVTSTSTSIISFKIQGSNLVLTTYADRSGFTATATIYYTKN